MWDYKIVKQMEDISREYLNDLGKAGWELIAVIYDGSKMQYYFKRPATY